MFYVTSTLIALVLLFIEVAFLPHFATWAFGSVFLLPFIVLISHRDKTIFPIFLSVFIGLLLDATTQNKLPIYAISFVLVTSVTKLFFSQFTAYGELRANIIVTLLGLFAIYSLEIFELSYEFTLQNTASFLIVITTNLFLNIFTLIVLFYTLQKYLGWLEKKTEDRFR